MPVTMLTGVATGSPSAGMVTVRLAGQTSTQQAAVVRSAYTLEAGDPVLVALQDGAAWVVGVLGVTTAVVVAPAAPPSSLVPVVTEVVSPSWSGTWRAGWRTDTSRLWCGDWTGRGINWGYSWYGTGCQGRGTITGGTAAVARGAGGVNGAVTLTMLLLPGTSRPAGQPTPLATAAGPSLAVNRSTDWGLPAAWLPRLQSGEAGGVGIGQASSAPYAQVDPISLTITCQR